MSTVLPSKCINVSFRHDSKCVLSIIITISDDTSWFASAFSFALSQSNFFTCHHICQAFDHNQFSCMVFLDISKAFDRVWHAGLLYKLEQHGISGDLLRWISSYLSDRTQSIVFNSTTSTPKPTSAGVPQGSVLGPLFIPFTR